MTCPKAMLQSLFLQQLVGEPNRVGPTGQRQELYFGFHEMLSFCRSCCDSKPPPSLAKLPVTATDECRVANWHDKSFGPFLTEFPHKVSWKGSYYLDSKWVQGNRLQCAQDRWKLSHRQTNNLLRRWSCWAGDIPMIESVAVHEITTIWSERPMHFHIYFLGSLVRKVFQQIHPTVILCFVFFRVCALPRPIYLPSLEVYRLMIEELGHPHFKLFWRLNCLSEFLYVIIFQ